MLSPRQFVASVCVLYLLAIGGQWLTTATVLSYLGLWPFLLLQPVLIGGWYLLHVRRLRNAGRSIAAAQGIALIHLLAIVLLVLVGGFFVDSLQSSGRMPASLVLVHELVTFSRGGDLLTTLGLVACAALLIPPAFSIWTAMQPARTA